MLHTRVTVVILTHNRVAEVVRTVQHFTNLTEQPALIVVDNGSSDGTSEILTCYFPAVRIIRLDRNRGAAARNVGIEHAQTPYVALCDDDVWWVPGALVRAAALLDAYPRVAVITGRVLVGPDNREDPTCQLMAESPLAADGVLPGPAILGFLAGASMVRRTAFLAVGGFEPRFFLGGEEALVAVDLATAGWSLAYVPDVLLHHYPSRQRDALTRRQLLLRNALWFTWLRRPFPSVVQHTQQLLRTVVRQPLLLRAVVEAVYGLPWVWSRRQVVSARIEAALRQLEKQQRGRRANSA